MGLFVCLSTLWLALLVAVWLVLGRSLRRSVYEAGLPAGRRDARARPPRPGRPGLWEHPAARHRPPMHDRT